MKTSDFGYQLPPALIAKHPRERGAAKLLTLYSDGSIRDGVFADIEQYFEAGDVLVLNDTKVIPARCYGSKESGGKFEMLFERPFGSEGEFLAQIRASKAPKPGQTLFLESAKDKRLQVVGRETSFFILRASKQGQLMSIAQVYDWLDQVGHIPLPPYIDRQDNHQDRQDYQTVMAKNQRAVAAPTAGLHYTQQLLQRLTDKGVRVTTITLHVGAGTYQPVRVDDVENHQMHVEWISVGEELCEIVNGAKDNGNKVIAAGTTSMRALESAALRSDGDKLKPYQGLTDIFIYPGFSFAVVDALQTNFHLPESTLLMLVSAFSGKKNIERAYQHAIEQQYRFFSYGDTMLLEKVE